MDIIVLIPIVRNVLICQRSVYLSRPRNLLSDATFNGSIGDGDEYDHFENIISQASFLFNCIISLNVLVFVALVTRISVFVLRSHL